MAPLLGAALVKHFVIVAALTLTACALPGISVTNSFMSDTHPTEDFCASRGLTLDSKTKQCVPAPRPAPPAAEVTGSLRQGAQQPVQSQSAASVTSTALPTVTAFTPGATPAQPPSQARPPAGSAPIEPDAVIYAELKQDVGLMSELTHFVRASGYRCDSISGLAPLAYGHGFKLVCPLQLQIRDRRKRWPLGRDRIGRAVLGSSIGTRGSRAAAVRADIYPWNVCSFFSEWQS